MASAASIMPHVIYHSQSGTPPSSLRRFTLFTPSLVPAPSAVVYWRLEEVNLWTLA
jgi:hypothetical protein